MERRNSKYAIHFIQFFPSLIEISRNLPTFWMNKSKLSFVNKFFSSLLWKSFCFFSYCEFTYKKKNEKKNVFHYHHHYYYQWWLSNEWMNINNEYKKNSSKKKNILQQNLFGIENHWLTFLSLSSFDKTEWGRNRVRKRNGGRKMFAYSLFKNTHTHIQGVFFRFYTRFNDEKECRASERKKVQYGHGEN